MLQDHELRQIQRGLLAAPSIETHSSSTSVQIEIEVEEQMVASFERDIKSRQEVNDSLRQNLEAIEELRVERDKVFAEKDS